MRSREGANTAKGTPELIELGQCLGAYGLKGGVRILSYTRPTDNIFTYKEFLLKKGESYGAFSLQRTHTSGGRLIVYFNGVCDRQSAEDLSGSSIYVDRVSLPTSAENQYYWVDLIGFKVLDADGKELGFVSGFIETGGHDVLRIAGKRELLIPFVMDMYILKVDMESSTIFADWHWED